MNNTAGRAIASALIDSDNACLLTPVDFITRMCPSIGSQSTIDLTIVHRDLLVYATIKIGPHIGSDHLPIMTSINAHPVTAEVGTPAGNLSNLIGQDGTLDYRLCC